MLNLDASDGCRFLKKIAIAFAFAFLVSMPACLSFPAFANKGR
jgi:hypothetical protein